MRATFNPQAARMRLLRDGARVAGPRGLINEDGYVGHACIVQLAEGHPVTGWVLSRYDGSDAWRFLLEALDSDIADVQGGHHHRGHTPRRDGRPGRST